MGKQKRQAVLGVLITAALVLSFVAMMAAVVMVSLPVFAFAAAVSYLADLLLHTAESSTLDRLRDSRFGLTIRFLIRQFLLLALCGAIIDLDSFVIQMTAVGLLLLFTLQLVYGAMIKRVKSERAALPFTTRGLDLEALGIRRLPHPFLTSKHVRKMLHLDVPLVVGAIGTVATDDWQYVTFGGIATVWLAFLAVLVLLPGARNALILPTPDEALDELNWQLGQYRPQVALYFTFAAVSRDFMYQVNMWLESLEELDLRPIIVLRERATLRFLDATSVPVICVPKAEYLARVEMPEAPRHALPRQRRKERAHAPAARGQARLHRSRRQRQAGQQQPRQQGLRRDLGGRTRRTRPLRAHQARGDRPPDRGGRPPAADAPAPLDGFGRQRDTHRHLRPHLGRLDGRRLLHLRHPGRMSTSSAPCSRTRSSCGSSTSRTR